MNGRRVEAVGDGYGIRLSAPGFRREDVIAAFLVVVAE